MSFIDVGRSGGVRAPLLFALAVHVAQRDVLAHGKAQDVVGGLQPEPEQVGIVAQLLALHQLERHLLVGIRRVQRLLGTLRFGEDVQQDDDGDDAGGDGQHQRLHVHALGKPKVGGFDHGWY